MRDQGTGLGSDLPLQPDVARIVAPGSVILSAALEEKAPESGIGEAQSKPRDPDEETHEPGHDGGE